jgi:hypothetical protein
MDMITERPVVRGSSLCHHRIYWTAIIVGTIVTFGLCFLLSLLNIGMGLSAFSLDAQTMTNLAIVGYIWLLISSVIILFIGGWVAGRLGAFSGLPRRFGVLYGFTTWSLALILTLAITPSINAYMPSNMHVVSNSSSREIAHSAPPSGGDTKVIVNTEKATNTIGKITLATFVIFLLTAIASGLGGYVGMRLLPETEFVERTETRSPEFKDTI